MRCPLKRAKPDSAFKLSAIRAGARVEHEHTTNDRVARTIAKHHLAEDPHYYEKLRVMERSTVRRGSMAFKSKTYRDPKTGEFITVGEGRRV